ncbi:MAG: hypothetical protein FWD32_00745 [Firmicutes bacterium]|nr:hypothetical protein [Bacillota bacterium]
MSQAKPTAYIVQEFLEILRDVFSHRVTKCVIGILFGLLFTFIGVIVFSDSILKNTMDSGKLILSLTLFCTGYFVMIAGLLSAFKWTEKEATHRRNILSVSYIIFGTALALVSVALLIVNFDNISGSFNYIYIEINSWLVVGILGLISILFIFIGFRKAFAEEESKIRRTKFFLCFTYIELGVALILIGLLTSISVCLEFTIPQSIITLSVCAVILTLGIFLLVKNFIPEHEHNIDNEWDN